jgi:hypothetical protein
MADARPFLITDSTGAPLTGAAAGMTVLARDVVGGVRTPPAVTEVGEGVYQVQVTDADETAGTVVLVDTGAGNEPRRLVLTCYKADGSNQFWAVCVEDPSGTLWAGAAPTIGSYRGKDGISRTPPAVVALAGAYLFAVVPTAADITADVEARIDGPAGSAQAYWNGSTEPIPTLPVIAPSTGMEGEAVVIRALREYLLAYLPGKVAQLNGLRAAALKSATLESFTVPASSSLVLAADRSSAGTTVALTSGVRTAAQVAADVNAAAVPGVTATTDGGRLVLIATATPAQDAPSVVAVKASTVNPVFGWDLGGEHVITSGLAAPSWRGVVDGWPVTVPDMGRSFWVILGDRNSVPISPDVRRDEVLVTLDVTVIKPEANMSPHRSREAISSCVRALRELLTTTDGRYLGRAGAGDVLFTSMSKVNIPGKPFVFSPAQNSAFSGVLFDVASFVLTVKVFQRPAS